MTLPRYYAIARMWSSHPPTHLMVAAYLGIKTTASPSEPVGSFDDLVRWIGGASAAGQSRPIR